MKFNVQIELDERDDMYDLQDAIISSAARQIINEQMNNRESYGKTFREALYDKVKKIMEESLDKDLKEQVTKGVIDDFAKRYDRTKQAKEIKNTYDIESDSVIKSELKDIISELVGIELKKRFK